MKRPVFILLVAVVFLVTVFLLAETLTVKMKTTNLRKTPKFYSSALTVLKAGEKVEKIGAQGEWLQIRSSSGVVGWIHSSSVMDKSFSLAGSQQNLKTQASASEIALAGKGFNKQVEENFRTKNPRANYIQVENMLKIVITPDQMRIFLEKGRLGEYGRRK
ncbi:MAG: SH3 domain-containing protein [Candidatus Aminicenantes bacterium]|nr:SH3 domain-containing protein [Candidatus Aminicenantes bacterium]